MNGRLFSVVLASKHAARYTCGEPLAEGKILIFLDNDSSEEAELLAERHKTGHGSGLTPFECECGELHEVIDGRTKYGVTGPGLKTAGGRHTFSLGKVRRNSSGRRRF